MAESFMGVDMRADRADEATIRAAEVALQIKWLRKNPNVVPMRRERVESGVFSIEYFANG